MPGVGGMAQPGKNRFDALSGYRQRKVGKSVPVPSKKAPKKPMVPKAVSMMYEERKASMQPPKSRKTAPKKRTSVGMKQPKFAPSDFRRPRRRP